MTTKAYCLGLAVLALAVGIAFEPAGSIDRAACILAAQVWLAAAVILHKLEGI